MAQALPALKILMLKGDALATNQTSDNNFITAKELNSGYSNTTIISDKSFNAVEFLDARNFPFLFRSIQSYNLNINDIVTFNQYILYSASDRSYSWIVKQEQKGRLYY